MRKGLLLTERDMSLLKYLVYGPATRINIFQNIFDKPNANKRTRERVMLRRMVKHQQEGLINSATCPTVKDTVYFLTRKGAPLVAAKYGMDLTDIWVNYNDKTLHHDLIAAGCAKKIVREDEKKHFDLSYIMLECSLKREKLKKGVYYPDLLVGIKGAEKMNEYHIEIDFGSISRKDFMGKINYFGDTILVVTKTSKRLDLLMWYLEVEGVTKPVYLTTSQNFLDTDFLSCRWHSNISETPVTIKIL